jgi:ribulose-5-phosphate 4-epimerase/fuculose-1-phosphate aldolase
MTTDARLREQLCLFAKSLFDRGYTHGATGNLSVRTTDNGLLVTPTGSSFGNLDPAQLSKLDVEMRLISGPPPTKEMPLHMAFYKRGAITGAVVHLHSCHSVALSMLPDVNPDSLLPPLTPYPIMRFGDVKLLPYFAPGDPAMGTAVEALAGKYTAVVLANHGPVVAAPTLDQAIWSIEELEAGAQIALLTHGLNPRRLTDQQVAALKADRF